MSFQKIRGHRKILEILTRVIKTRRLAHAYVFSGPGGIGKRLTAIGFAKNLLCRSADSDSCDRCAVCIQVERGNHHDLSLLEPDKGVISVDAIRNLKRELSRKSFAGGYKICIINEAEKMNIQAENALLKTLEEPTPDTIIILITGRPYRLLPTVLSRCQHLKFQPLAVSETSDLIMEKAGVNQEDALLMASLTGGSPGKALELQIDFLKELRDTLIDQTCSAPDEEFFKVAEDFLSDKESWDLKLNLFRIWYRDLIFYKIFGNADCLLNKDKAEAIASLSSVLSVKKILWTLFDIEKYSHTLEHNVNPQLTMEALLLKLNPKTECSFVG